MAGELASSARRVQEALGARRLACRVVELPDTTRSAQDELLRATAGQVVSLA